MDRRPAYKLNDLKRLHIALHGVKDWKRWIILIGRYSGMRQNEICQLYHNDVMKVDGVWCFRVDNLNPNQTLKTDSSRRFVPIHSQLLTLGLLDFIKDRKGHLFPELTLHLGSYGHYFSRWFTRFRGKHSCLNIIHCATMPPQHLNRMASLNSSLRRCSDTRMQRSRTIDTGRALMSRDWLNWWSIYDGCAGSFVGIKSLSI